jgi:hypothetical protein
MTMNWHELATFVHFCNRLGIKAFFNTVLFPKAYSLTSFSSQQLEEVLRELPSPSSFSVTNPVEQYNQLSYVGVLDQIKKWKEEAIYRAQASQPVQTEIVFSREAYFLALREYCVTDPEIIHPDRNRLFDEIREKLSFIIDESIRHNAELEIMKQLSTIDFKTIIQYVPGSEQKDLYQMFKAVFLVAE